MPLSIPLIAFGAAFAYAASRETSVEKLPDSEQLPSDTDEEVGEVYTGRIDWGPLLEEYRGSIPRAFLDRWIQHESGGNPCSTGMWGGPWEAGIGQVYFGVNQRNERINGVTLNELRECCYIGKQQMASQPTDRQMRANVSSLVDMAREYIGIAGRKLSSLGLTWHERDILCFAKLYHALPVLTTSHFSVATRNSHTRDWDSYRRYAGPMTREEVLRWDQDSGYGAGKGAAPFWPLDRLFSNAEFSGKGTK